MKTISPTELQQSLHDQTVDLVIDVRLPEDFNASRILAAKNNCVFEVTFIERMKDLSPETKLSIVVYGDCPDSLEGRVAAEKLERAGYGNVRELSGGLAAWRSGGLPVNESGPAAPSPKVPEGRQAIDLAESRVEWIGRNLLNKHTGKIPLAEGHLILAGGNLTGGEFVFDMNGITCDDLAGNPLHDVLVRHLRSDDFFDTERFPQGRFVITHAKPLSDASPGAPNLQVTGSLTLKGITAPVEFTACAGITPEGKAAAQAAVFLDRTRWNVLYGSGKFFHRLAGHLVNDVIELQLRIVTA